MLSNTWNTKSGIITTNVMGGRPHFPYRQPARLVGSYPRQLGAGENFYTLAAVIFADERDYWALQDMNNYIDPTNTEQGTVVNLPKDLVRNENGVPKFF